ncbi:MAG TPA: tyrosine-type recombinase/integrase [Ktedonobacteraceae bacterium]|nr:tyrosine-type recombinase/integrase [Ktedonobacteraceae bacterium]
MHVVEVETEDHQKRYVVIDDAGVFVEPIVRYLKYLDRISSARQTLRSYAFTLKQYWEYLIQQQLDWKQVTLDDLSRFILWLKVPSGSLKVLPAHPVPQARSNRTINHALTVVRSFYDYHWRVEETVPNVKDKTTTFLPAHTRRYKAFLHHITKGSLVEKNILKQPEAKRQRPKTISKDQIQQLLDACLNQRDRLLIRLLYESAIRVGEALSLWVQDVDVAANQLHICDRGPLENGAEIKTIHAPRSVDVSADLIDEIVAYVGIVHRADVETNHLFLKQHGVRAGQALTYADVDSLFRRLRSHTGIVVTPHMLRHTMLTALAEQGWAPELLQQRAGHASFQQTYQTYVHPSQEALRSAWEKAEVAISLARTPQEQR